MSRAASIGLFVFFQSLYALTSSGNVFRIPDEFEVYFQTEHLIDAGDLSVPQATEIRQSVVANGKVVGTQSMFFGKVVVSTCERSADRPRMLGLSPSRHRDYAPR